MPRRRNKPIRKVLVANRGEIAIRVMRAATELGITTVSVYSNEDRFALHRFKADESYPVGAGKGPVEAYLDIDGIVAVARSARVDAIHPGYGFLAENPDFAEACKRANITFIGPDADVMRRLGNKVAARKLAVEAGVAVMPATDPLPDDVAATAALADEIGYPVMVNASWGGGGRGMRMVDTADELANAVSAARGEARAAFGNDEVYLEKLVRHARHVEVQVLADVAGNAIHLFERDCTVQRRHQKVVERAPAPFLSDAERRTICDAALSLVRTAGYRNAGTVEFLQDADTSSFYFIEVNPRIQVEHTVTECVTGIDIVKAQIRIAEGAEIGAPESGIPKQDDITLFGHAIQCRVTTESPEANFTPDHGRIETYRSASGFGIRLDAGSAFAGALITPHYDSLLVKVTAWGREADEANARMDRALREFRIRGVSTNLRFLESVINHPKFRSAEYTTRFIDETPELFAAPPRRDRATRLLAFVGETIVNGNPEVIGHARPALDAARRPPEANGAIPPGTRQRLDEMGADAFARWMKDETRVLVTDTTFRDAHQSLLATRVRSHDLLAVAPAYARLMPELFSIECWGGATFDVAMRFLKESPWQRLDGLRERIPNVLFQMLLRASNAVGYSNYPDNAVQFFVQQAADAGIDVFRIFDSLNWAENMKVAIEAVLETGRLCEAAICYTGDVLDPDRSKYDLDYYLGLARELTATGAHILGLKDMAGVCRPEAARLLVRALREETGLPVHFHTHDTSGAGAASVLAAIEAGVDAVDAAVDAMSGLTSQPSLGSIVAALRHTPRETGLDMAAIRVLSAYWEGVRRLYAPFESDLRWGASEVYMHEMPGGQYTNLRQQAAALGLGARWPEVASAYADVNRMFGDVIKVTPTSKVVGDLALMMVSQNLTANDIEAPDTPVSFPDSVISFFRGDVGQPPGGFPEALQRKVLAGEMPLTERPGKTLAPVDLDAARGEVEKRLGRQRVSEREIASHLMYPQVFADFATERRRFGDVSVLPTATFFYGMEPGEEITASIERGKTLVIRFLALGDVDARGERSVFFELNGQPRTIKVADRNATPSGPVRAKADTDDPRHVGAPMPSVVVAVAVEPNRRVAADDALVTLEAMKMETTVRAERDGIVAEVIARIGDNLETGDLLVVLDDGD